MQCSFTDHRITYFKYHYQYHIFKHCPKILILKILFTSLSFHYLSLSLSMVGKPAVLKQDSLLYFKMNECVIVSMMQLVICITKVVDL